MAQAIRAFKTVRIPVSVAEVALRAASREDEDVGDVLHDVIPPISGFIFGFISEVLKAGGKYVLYDKRGTPTGSDPRSTPTGSDKRAPTETEPTVAGDLFETMNYSVKDAVMESLDALGDSACHTVALNYPDRDVKGICELFTYFTGERAPANVVEVMINAALLLNATMWDYQTFRMPKEFEVCVQGPEGILRELRTDIPYSGHVIVETINGLKLEPWHLGTRVLKVE